MSPTSPAASLPDVGVLIPAAGSGERAGDGEPKQFRLLAGHPMLLHAIRPFARHADVRHVVVAVPPAQAAAPPAWLSDIAGERLTIVAGGATRAESVRRALAVLDPACSVVLVHDAARPLVSHDEIDAVIAVARAGEGAVPALAVADTLKRVGRDGRVEHTEDRTGLWRALTPQGFPRAMMERAFGPAAAGDASDCASMVEASGGSVRLVAGSPRNLKVTTADDLALAEALLRP